METVDDMETLDNKGEYMVYINIQATKHGTSSASMKKTMKCESSYNPNAVGDGGTSHGLSQIHLPAHKTVSLDEARDPKFAIEFMAENFGKGNAPIWTCYRLTSR